jgi:hypothetical protein
MRTFPLAFLLPVLLPAALGAQTIAGSFSPNPAPPGVPITIKCTDALGQGLNLPSPCSWFSIRQGSQLGPNVTPSINCPSVIVPVAPHGTFQFTWNQQDGSGQLVPNGTYWFRVRAWDTGFTVLHEDWFCISIQTAGEPALTAAGPARLGLTTPLQITAPSEPGAVYIVACSLSSNTPIVVPGLPICLSEPLFFAPFTSPAGFLDGSGSSSGLGLVVPSAPAVLWQGLHVQSLILGASALRMTNDVSFTVQP